MLRKARILLIALMIWPIIAIPEASLAEETRDGLLLRVSPSTLTVFFQFDKDEMWLKASVNGSNAAEPVQALYTSSANQKSSRFVQFPKVLLPLTKEQRPRNVTQIVAGFRYVVPPDGKGASVVGGLTQSCKQKNGSEWTYLQSINKKFDQSKTTPVVELANLDKMKFSVTVRRKQNAVYVGVSILAGDATLYDIRRDGKSVPVEVRLLDGNGKEIANKKAPLGDFGFG